MKILKPKIDMIVKCECGCEFEFDLEDIMKENYYPFNIGAYEEVNYVECPICNKPHTIDLKERIIKE